jgi:uncharacterized membrane protein YdjX (TVP38/TMEM64 family)
VNLAAALAGVPLATFAGATLLGIIPGAFAFAIAGDGLDSVIEARQSRVEACRALGRVDCSASLEVMDLVTPEVALAIAALGLVTLLTVVMRHRLKPARAAPDAGAGHRKA